MLNPLIKKQNKPANSNLSKSSREEAKDQIFCRLCKIKYTITAYQEHISLHKRKERPSISTYYKKNCNYLKCSIDDKESLCIKNDRHDISQLKEIYFSQSRQSQQPQNHKNDENSTFRHSINTSVGFAKMHSLQLKKSFTSEKQDPQQQNPEFKEGKASMIDLLKSQKGLRQSDLGVISVDQIKKPHNLFDDLMESLSQHKIKQINQLMINKQ